MYFSTILFIVSIASSEIYNKENGTKLFEYFIMKYNKDYKNEREKQRGLENFINNVNKISDLNEKSGDKNTLYVVNMHADMNTEEFHERYALRLKPYTNAKDPTEANILRDTKENYEFKNLEGSSFYDLTKADELYMDFMKKYNRTIAKKKIDRTARYYRFIKTLVEINNHNAKGLDIREIDEYADKIIEPLDYFY